MIHPLTLIPLCNLSDEIKYKIQSYLINEASYKALQEYFNYLFYKKELYQDFCYLQYVRPNCKCYTYYNSNAHRLKTRECYHCEKFEYSHKYIPNDFVECILDNNQFLKINNFKNDKN